MKIDKALKRDKKIFKREHGQRVSGKSVFIIQEVLIKRSKKKKRGK